MPGTAFLVAKGRGVTAAGSMIEKGSEDRRVSCHERVVARIAASRDPSFTQTVSFSQVLPWKRGMTAAEMTIRDSAIPVHRPNTAAVSLV